MFITSVRPSIRSFVRSSLSRARGDGDERQRPASVWASLVRVWTLECAISFLSWMSSVVCQFVGSLGILLFFCFCFSCEWKCRYNIDPFGRVRRCICCCRGFTQYLVWLYSSRAEGSCILVFSCLLARESESEESMSLRASWLLGFMYLSTRLEEVFGCEGFKRRRWWVSPGWRSGFVAAAREFFVCLCWWAFFCNWVHVRLLPGVWQPLLGEVEFNWGLISAAWICFFLRLPLAPFITTSVATMVASPGLKPLYSFLKP